MAAHIASVLPQTNLIGFTSPTETRVVLRVHGADVVETDVPRTRVDQTQSALVWLSLPETMYKKSWDVVSLFTDASS